MNSPTYRWMKVKAGRGLGGANRAAPDRSGVGAAEGGRS